MNDLAFAVAVSFLLMLIGALPIVVGYLIHAFFLRLFGRRAKHAGYVIGEPVWNGLVDAFYEPDARIPPLHDRAGVDPLDPPEWRDPRKPR